MFPARRALVLMALSLGLMALALPARLQAASEVTLGAKLYTQSPNVVYGELILPAGVSINQELTSVNAVVTRGNTAAGAVITVFPTSPDGITAFSGTLVGVTGVPNQGPVGGALTLFLP